MFPLRCPTGGYALFTTCLGCAIAARLRQYGRFCGNSKQALDDGWGTVVGKNSISGYRSGFNHWPNAYIWNMAVHDGWMYASTYDQVSPLRSFVEELPQMILAMMGTANPFDGLEIWLGQSAD